MQDVFVYLLLIRSNLSPVLFLLVSFGDLDFCRRIVRMKTVQLHSGDVSCFIWTFDNFLEEFSPV